MVYFHFQNYCKSHGAQLAQIGSMEENAFLKDYVSRLTGRNTPTLAIFFNVIICFQMTMGNATETCVCKNCKIKNNKYKLEVKNIIKEI